MENFSNDSNEVTRRRFLGGLMAASLFASAESAAASTFGYDEETFRKGLEKRLIEIDQQIADSERELAANGCTNVNNDNEKVCADLFQVFITLQGEKMLILNSLKKQP